ncbi:cyclin-like protein [Zopfochytrium polystomum]|nr:cyclin-like protein [Zopfochytrium polystomum]
MSLSLKNAVVPPSVLAAGATPSRRDGITVGREHLLRVEGARLIAEVGILLRLPQTSIGTAQILFQRFYYVASFRDHQPNDMVLGSIFLASKAEETPRKMKDIINVFFFLTEGHDKDVGAEVPSNRLYALKEAMIAAELQILVKLGFNVQVQHPHGFMINYLQSLDLSDDKDFAQLAWNYLNDSMWTEIVAIYQPHVIACGAILLASRVRKIRLPSQPPWWELFDARMEDNEQFLPALYVSSVLTEFLFRSCTFRDCLRAFNRVVPIDEYCLNVYNGKWVACTNCSDTKFLKFVLRQNLEPMSNEWIGPEPTTASADTTAGSNCLPDPLQFKHSLPDTGEQPNDREPPVARKRLHGRETSPENTTDK